MFIQVLYGESDLGHVSRTRHRTVDASISTKAPSGKSFQIAGVPFTSKGNIVHGTLKAVSYVALLLMAVGILYASYISIKYWTGISV